MSAQACAGHDSGGQESIIPRRDLRPSSALSLSLERQRAQGTPDAGRTREPCVQRKVHFAHASNDRAAVTTGVPCAMVLRLIRGLLGVPGLLASVARGLVTRELDPSVGGSGPHDFAVREDAFVGALSRVEHPHVHRSPLPTSVTTAIRPSWWRRDDGSEPYIYEKRKLNIFAGGGLT